ncbi:MAG: NUDIX domain-containing protein, partial [Streptococcaceae bacterium]|nr:NUDIX domain-containing protein [Streptococcaceae bacterium]
GPYTATAIASISFNQAEPAIDGNLMRVSSRLLEIDADISKASSRKVFDENLRKLISDEYPGDFNQSLMDLGSKVCTPKIARCEECPVQKYCQSTSKQTQYNYPVKTKKLKQKDVYYLAFALENSLDQYYLEKRSDKGLLANMWTFPLIEVPKEEYDKVIKDQTRAKIPHSLPDTVSRTQFVGQATHIFSHLKWHMALIAGQPEEYEIKEKTLLDYQAWLSEKDMEKTALAGPQVKLFKLLKEEKI